MILYRVIFSCSVLKLEMPRSQTQLLFHEILHLKEPLVVLLAFYHFGTEQGEAISNITLYHKSVPA